MTRSTNGSAARRAGGSANRGKAPLAALALAISALLLLGAPALAVAEGPSVDFVSPASLTPSQTKPADVFLRNSGPAPARVRFRALSVEGAATVAPKSAILAPFSVRHIQLTLAPTDTGAAQSGELIATAPGLEPAALAYSSGPAKGTEWWVYVVLAGSLLAAALLVALRWRALAKVDVPKDKGGPYELTDRIGPVQWDFSKSWASGLTVVGALLGTIIAAGVLPEHGDVPKSTYGALNLLFGALIVLAPLSYAATQRTKGVDRAKTVKEPQYQGFIWSFLVSSAITLWAVLGEIGTSFAIFYELREESSLPIGALVLLALVMAGALVLVLLSAWYTLGQTIIHQRDKKARRRRHIVENEHLFTQMNPTEREAVEPPLRAWSPL